MSNIEDEKDFKNLNDGEHIEDLPYDAEGALGQRRGTIIDQDFGVYISDASAAVDQQKEQSLGGALRMYRWGIIYSIVFSS